MEIQYKISSQKHYIIVDILPVRPPKINLYRWNFAYAYTLISILPRSHAYVWMEVNTESRVTTSLNPIIFVASVLNLTFYDSTHFTL